MHCQVLTMDPFRELLYLNGAMYFLRPAESVSQFDRRCFSSHPQLVNHHTPILRCEERRLGQFRRAKSFAAADVKRFFVCFTISSAGEKSRPDCHRGLSRLLVFFRYLDEQELVSLLGVLSKLCSPGRWGSGIVL